MKKTQEFQEIEFEENYERTKPIGKLILLVAFTAIMLITSTYAWFSAQRQVTIAGLAGTVEAAEGLQVSLDAENWTNVLDLSDSAITTKAYSGNSNIMPEELLPVSTTGIVAEGTTEIPMYRGETEDDKKLTDIAAVSTAQADSTKSDYPGYIAFDLFVKNTGDAEEAEKLSLMKGSNVDVTATGVSTTGLQNTVRVGFAKYSEVCTDVLADADTILAATNKNTSVINQISIWEPNADKHVAKIEEDFGSNKVKKTADTYYTVADGTVLPTYALKDGAVNQTITDIYDWSGTNDATMAEQKTVQTNATELAGATQLTTTADENLTIKANEITKLRVYVWLEGQDVDCTSWASQGGGIEVNFGLVKGEEEVAGGGTTLAEITNDDIGEYIDLGLSLVGEEDKTTDDWRILYVDEEKGQVYAMLNDYLPNDVNGKNYAQLAGLNTLSTYTVNSTVNRDDLVTKLKSTWTDLTTDLGIDGATVSGTPTGDMLQLSYNYKNEDIDYTTKPILTGDMWVKPQKGDTYGYWLASAYGSVDGYVWAVAYNGYVSGCGYDEAGIGVCPVVCLSSDINAELVNDIWTVVK